MPDRDVMRPGDRLHGQSRVEEMPLDVVDYARAKYVVIVGVVRRDRLGCAGD